MHFGAHRDRLAARRGSGVVIAFGGPNNRAFIAHVHSNVEHYNNIGVRIEDDYAITAKGLELIGSTPREIDEIETIMRNRPSRP